LWWWWWWWCFFFFFVQPQAPPWQRTERPFPQAGQTLPHLPQSAGLVARSTQRPLQLVSVVGQFDGGAVQPQAPPAQKAVPPFVQAGQTVPHFPQFCALLPRSTHVVPQDANGGGHTGPA